MDNDLCVSIKHASKQNLKPFQAKFYNNQAAKMSGSVFTLLSLSACGGGGTSGGAVTPGPAAALTTSTFELTSTNAFLANSDLPGTFNQPNSTADVTVLGQGGDDTITTGSGNDFISGGSGADIINSGAGNDIVDGGSGGDTMDGGSGAGDILDYRDSATRVIINLETSTASGGDATGDTFTNFEGVYGSVGNDSLRGDENDNFFWGNEGNDVINAGGGSDFIEASLGGDTINGGDGNDYLSYFYSNSAVTVNLLTNVNSGGLADGDNISNVEVIYGSKYADNITGNGLNNTIAGNGGADVMDGGDGIDALAYFFSTSSVTVNLATGTSSGGDAAGDTFSNFENIWGSDYADILTGDENDNAFSGNGGNDVINGAGGNDHFYSYQSDGSATSDQFDGGDGYDKFEFESGSAITAYNVNLSNVDAVNIEFIRMGHVQKESLTLTAQDVIDVTDADNILNVIVHAEDAVSSASTWAYVNDVMSVGEIYHQYTSGAATINIYFEAGTQTGFAKPTATFTETSTDVYDAIGNGNSSISLVHEEVDLTISGKDGDDLITSGLGDDVLNGGNGNDSLRGNSGTDILNGGAGNDILIYDEDNTYDGGANDDTLLLVWSATEIDLSSLIMTNMETIDLSDIYTNSLTLTAQDVLDVTDGNNFLTIDGNVNDTVSLTGAGWAQGADNGAYHTYTSGGSTLFVDMDISQSII